MVVLLSGRGSNLQALIDAEQDPTWPARIVRVISNVAGAGGLARAEAAGIPTAVVSHKGRSRDELERALLAEIDLGERPEWVVLAGFMRVLGATFLDRFAGRVLNIHPALLPAFPGLHAAAQALAAGVTQAGATVHLVDTGVDTGPILAQGTVPVRPDDTEDSLAARILRVEHQLYPMVLRQACEGRIGVDGRRVTVSLRPGESRWIFVAE